MFKDTNLDVNQSDKANWRLNILRFSPRRRKIHFIVMATFSTGNKTYDTIVLIKSQTQDFMQLFPCAIIKSNEIAFVL